jgi:hypothetical protein
VKGKIFLATGIVGLIIAGGLVFNLNKLDDAIDLTGRMCNMEVQSTDVTASMRASVQFVFQPGNAGVVLLKGTLFADGGHYPVSRKILFHWQRQGERLSMVSGQVVKFWEEDTPDNVADAILPPFWTRSGGEEVFHIAWQPRNALIIEREFVPLGMCSFQTR